MKRTEATELYNNSWDGQFTSMEDVFARIKALSSNGAYQMCVMFENTSEYDAVRAELIELGYDVEVYNGTDDILEVTWG